MRCPNQVNGTSEALGSAMPTVRVVPEGRRLAAATAPLQESCPCPCLSPRAHRFAGAPSPKRGWGHWQECLPCLARPFSAMGMRRSLSASARPHPAAHGGASGGDAVFLGLLFLVMSPSPRFLVFYIKTIYLILILPFKN